MFEFWNYTPYWTYGNIYGRCFDCDDREFILGPLIYGKITFNRFARESDEEAAASMSPFDMRTLEDIKAGCCPPRLMSELLKEDTAT